MTIKRYDLAIVSLTIIAKPLRRIIVIILLLPDWYVRFYGIQYPSASVERRITMRRSDPDPYGYITNVERANTMNRHRADDIKALFGLINDEPTMINR